MSIKKFFLSVGVILMLMPMACTEKESDLGVNLQDPFTLYQGVRDTVAMTAFTVYDDSLSGAGYVSAVFGNYCVGDPVFGNVRAVSYSQIAAPKEGVRISDDVVFDSVVMTLVIDTVYPIMPDSTPRDLHVIVKQLAQPLMGDSAYLSSNELAESDVCFFDGHVTYYADSIKIKLNENVYPVLRQSCSQADFLNLSKGISIRLGDDNNNTMLSVNYSATNTRLMLFYHTPNADNMKFEFTINSGAAHSMYYSHDYAGSALAPFASNKKDSIAGTQKLYLEPLGGTRLRLNMQSFVAQFKRDHPNAVVHYAELVLPLANEADTANVPVRLLALKRLANGKETYVTDANVLTNSYTYNGFDGYYNREKNQYRMRLTRHLQEILREGKDYGTEVVIDARRSAAFRTIINGTETSHPIMIDFIYSE